MMTFKPFELALKNRMRCPELMQPFSCKLNQLKSTMSTVAVSWLAIPLFAWSTNQRTGNTAALCQAMQCCELRQLHQAKPDLVAVGHHASSCWGRCSCRQSHP
jgi:hypothetical protein